MANTATASTPAQNTQETVNKYRQYANSQVDENAILNKYKAANEANYAQLRNQTLDNENKFYDQMYNTQKTAMDTIRKNNASAVATGASRGMQAANELSAILGLQQNSASSATELANANREAMEKQVTASIENEIKAGQEAEANRQSIIDAAIKQASVDAERYKVDAEAKSNLAATQAQQADTITSAAETNATAYNAALQASGVDTKANTAENKQRFDTAVSSIAKGATFSGDDWKGSATGHAKAQTLVNDIINTAKAYGLNQSIISQLEGQGQALLNAAQQDASFWGGIGIGTTKTDAAKQANNYAQIMINTLKNGYAYKQQ